jgi:hypothetical protein
MNTSWCADEQESVAKDILFNNPKGYVAVAWEHANIPGVISWLMALSENPSATQPWELTVPIQKWYGNVFDQFWIVDLRQSPAKFLVEPQRILSDDCSVARSMDGACPTGEPTVGNDITTTDHKNTKKIVIVISLFVLLCFLLRKHL